MFGPMNTSVASMVWRYSGRVKIVFLSWSLEYIYFGEGLKLKGTILRAKLGQHRAVTSGKQPMDSITDSVRVSCLGLPRRDKAECSFWAV